MLYIMGFVLYVEAPNGVTTFNELNKDELIYHRVYQLAFTGLSLPSASHPF